MRVLRTVLEKKNRAPHYVQILDAVVLCIIFLSAEVELKLIVSQITILTDAAICFQMLQYSLSSQACGWRQTCVSHMVSSMIKILGALTSILLIWLVAVLEDIDRIIHDCVEVEGFL